MGDVWSLPVLQYLPTVEFHNCLQAHIRDGEKGDFAFPKKCPISQLFLLSTKIFVEPTFRLDKVTFTLFISLFCDDFIQ